MRALSLYQPYASLMAFELKRNETRGRCWRCLLGDEVAICSARKFPAEFRSRAYHDEIFKEALGVLGLIPTQRYGMVEENLPLGVVLCVLEVRQVSSSEFYNAGAMIEFSISEMERAFGDYSPGRTVYGCERVRRLHKPVPVRGYQGIFNLPMDVEREVRKQIDD